MKEELILAGFGGQGIVIAGKIVAKAAVKEGKNITHIPTYGPETRGGKARCFVIISDKKIGSPVSEKPDTLIVMNRPSLEFEAIVKPGGLIIVNKSIVGVPVTRTDVEVLYIEANKIALELKEIQAANMVMLGVYVAKKQIVSSLRLIEAVVKTFEKEKPDSVETNIQAFRRGFEAAKKIMEQTTR